FPTSAYLQIHHDAHASCIYCLCLLEDKAARWVSIHVALRILVEAVQQDLGVGDNSTGVVLHNASHTSERGLCTSSRSSIQKQTNNKHWKHPDPDIHPVQT